MSLDGPRAIHDGRRVDKKGEGTFERVMEGLRSLMADEKILKRGLGGLCVIDPQADGAN